MIELETKAGKAVMINTSHITTVEPNTDGGCSITLTGLNTPLEVILPYTELKEILIPKETSVPSVM